MKKQLLLFFFSLFVLFSTHAQIHTSPQMIRLAVTQLSEENYNNEITEETIELLKKELGVPLEVTYYSIEDFVNAIKNGMADIAISGSGLYRLCLDYGIKELVTTASDQAPNPNHSAAALFLKRKDRKDIQNLEDLKGKTASATRPLSITGLIMSYGEIAAHGYDPYSFFKDVRFTMYPMSAVIENVLNGSADVGFIWSCYYEELKRRNYPDIDKVEPFLVKNDNKLSCLHSTEVYPGHTVSVTPSASPDIAKKVTQILLNMPKTSQYGFYWTVGTDFHALDTLFKNTKYGPYSYLRDWTFRRIWEEYDVLVILFGLTILFWLVYTIRVKGILKAQQIRLERAIDKQRIAQSDALKKGYRIQSLERLGAVQQLSSMLAHELKQPLAATQYYLESLINRLDKKSLDEQLLKSTLQKIHALNVKSSNLIDHVRSYSKKAVVKRIKLDVNETIESTFQNLQGSEIITQRVSIVKEIPHEKIFLYADRLEIELVLLNLLKNSVEATSSRSTPAIIFTLRKVTKDSKEGIEITVTDNGPEISEEVFLSLMSPMNSTKQEGLGLGIAIVQRIAEAYGGSLKFQRVKPCGLKAIVTLFNSTIGQQICNTKGS